MARFLRYALYVLFHFGLLGYGVAGVEHSNETISIESIVISISPAHFETVLKSKSPFMLGGEGNDQHEQFLDKFNKFLLVFNFRDETDESYQQLRRIIRATHKYNLMLVQNGGTQILKLWISIIPHGTLTEQMVLIESIKNDPNSYNLFCVEALFLNYRYLRVDSQTLPLVNQDLQTLIQKSRILINGDIALGLILDGRNCYGSGQYFNKLALGALDLVAFITNDFGQGSYTFDINTRNACVNRMFHIGWGTRIRIPFGFRYPFPTELSIANMTYSFSKEQLESYVASVQAGDLRVGIFRIMDAETAEYKRNRTTDPVMRSQEQQVKWLRSDFQFNRQYTGISVYSSYERLDPIAPIPLILNQFCKVMVHQREILKEANKIPFRKFVDKLFKSASLAQNVSKYIADCNGSFQKLFLVVQPFHNVNEQQPLSEYRHILGPIMSIAARMDRKYPKVSNTIIFSSNDCFDEQTCPPSHDEHHGTFRNLFGITYHAKQLISFLKIDSKPKIGVMFDWHICPKFYLIRNDKFDAYFSAFDQADMGIFKIHIHKNQIIGEGALKASTEIISNLTVCGSFLEMMFDRPGFQYAYHVIIYGCYSASDKFLELREIARFWEFVSQWAASIQTLVFIGAAVEDGTKPNGNSSGVNTCTLNDSKAAKEDCDCGWWRTVPLPATNLSATSNVTVVLETRKSIALKIIEESADSNRTRHESKQAENDTPILLKFLVPITLFAVLVMATSVVLVLSYRQNRTVRGLELYRFLNGSNGRRPSDSQGTNAGTNTDILPYDKERHEIPSSKFKIDFSGKTLGSGEFSTVHRGTVRRSGVVTKVAVKVVNKLLERQSHESYLALKSLLSEIKILSYAGEHQHVIKFIGAHTERLGRGKLFVFLEIGELGSLLNYLRVCQMTHPPDLSGTESNSLENNAELQKPSDEHPTFVTLQVLKRWSRDIADGMEFLHSKKLVHADLAARNVLLDSTKCAKISDFGLSRRLYEYTEYMKQEAGPLPWKWMAPESFRKMFFNEKSDVWAFGVTLWEIFTLGDEPYPGLSWTDNFPTQLESGLRLDEPRYSDGQINAVMEKCWSTYPGDRPNFLEIKSLLE